MIKNFTDRDGQKYELILRGRLKDSVNSSKKLKSILDNSTSYDGLKKLHPSYSEELLKKLSESYSKKSYLQIMRDFGIVNQSYRKG